MIRSTVDQSRQRVHDAREESRRDRHTVPSERQERERDEEGAVDPKLPKEARNLIASSTHRALVHILVAHVVSPYVRTMTGIPPSMNLGYFLSMTSSSTHVKGQVRRSRYFV